MPSDDRSVLYPVISGAPAPEGLSSLVMMLQSVGWRVVVFSNGHPVHRCGGPGAADRGAGPLGVPDARHLGPGRLWRTWCWRAHCRSTR
jgi:hypothetical protein